MLPATEILGQVLKILVGLVFLSGFFILVLALLRKHQRASALAHRVILQERLAELFTSWQSGSKLPVTLSPEERRTVEELILDPGKFSVVRASFITEKLKVSRETIHQWIQNLSKGDVGTRARAALALGSFGGSDESINALIQGTQDSSVEVRTAALISLGKLGSPKGISGPLRFLENHDDSVPLTVLVGVLVPCARSRPRRILDLLKSSKPRHRIVASWTLSETADEAMLPSLLRATKDPEPEVRAKIARALGRIHSAAALQALKQLAEDPVWFVRVRALHAFCQLRVREGSGLALQSLVDENQAIRFAAARALREIEGFSEQTLLRAQQIGGLSAVASLLSEWERAGFLWNAVWGLSPSQPDRFQQNRRLIEKLVAFGLTKVLLNYLVIFPDLKIRLRLLRLLIEQRGRALVPELVTLQGEEGLEPRLAEALRRAIKRLVEAPPQVSSLEHG